MIKIDSIEPSLAKKKSIVGFEWISKPAPATGNWESIAYGKGLFVAVSSVGPNRIITSADGVNWVLSVGVPDSDWEYIVYGDGLFVVVGISGSLMTSFDGINWELQVTPLATINLESVAYGNNLFVAVADSGTGDRVITSPDGFAWTSRQPSEDNDWEGIAYGNVIFIAVSSNGTNRIMSSSDGITWAAQSAPVVAEWESVTYGNGIFVAVSNDGKIIRSKDADSWVESASPVNNNWRNVTYAEGIFIAVSNTGTSNRIITSSDGITWTTRLSPVDSDWNGTIYGNGIFVAVATDGISDRIMCSGAQVLAQSTDFNVLTNAKDNKLLGIEEFSINFANSDERIFGELGLPANQDWESTASGSATVEIVSDDVLGIQKDVLKINDNTGDGIVRVFKEIDVDNWLSIQAFGVSFSGLSRLDSTNGFNGFSARLIANDNENPLADGKRRYAFNAKKSGDHLRIEETDDTGNNIIFDGTGGKQLILFDEYFKWELVIAPSLVNGILYINDLITTLELGFKTNIVTQNSSILVESGSTGGTDRISYHDNYGATIYEESGLKTIDTKDMVHKDISIIIPRGKRDYVITIPDNSPRNIGETISILANNVLGTSTVKTEDLNNPQVLIAGQSQLDFEVVRPTNGLLTNRLDQGNVYSVSIGSVFMVGEDPHDITFMGGNVGLNKQPEERLDVDGTVKATAMMLGSDAPIVKMKKLTGTTGATEGDVTTIAHGLNVTDILAIDVLITTIVASKIPPHHTITAELEYDFLADTDDIVVSLSSTNSGSLLSRMIMVLVTYEE